MFTPHHRGGQATRPRRLAVMAASLAAVGALLGSLGGFGAASAATGPAAAHPSTSTGPTVYEHAAINQNLSIAVGNEHTSVPSSPVLPKGTAGASSTGGGTAGRLASPAWTVQSTPNPAAAISSYLQGVACTSASSCTAVGYYENSSLVPFALAERWNGTSWSVQATGNPNPTTPATNLSGVSCTSASACTAAGFNEGTTGEEATLVEEWDGTSWATPVTPSPSSVSNYLNGVSCASATACTAVGYYTTSSGASTLAERE